MQHHNNYTTPSIRKIVPSYGCGTKFFQATYSIVVEGMFLVRRYGVSPLLATIDGDWNELHSVIVKEISHEYKDWRGKRRQVNVQYQLQMILR
jgi:hypothetical protein